MKLANLKFLQRNTRNNYGKKATSRYRYKHMPQGKIEKQRVFIQNF